MWKSVHEAGLNIDTNLLAEAPGGQAAVQVFRRVWTASAHDAVDRAEKAERGPEIRVMVSDLALRLTRERGGPVRRGTPRGVADAWRERGHRAGQDARTYQLLQILQPARDADVTR